MAILTTDHTAPLVAANARRFRMLAASLALLFIALQMGIDVARARIPFELDYEEGNILNAGVRLSHGLSPYPDPTAFPYVINPYGPVGYLLTAASIRMFGISFFAPRLLVLAGGMIVLIALIAVSRLAECQFEFACAAAALLVCSPMVTAWLPVLRVDFWALALSLAGLYLFMAFPRAVLLPSVLLAAALLTKLTALAAPIACGAELLLSGNRRRFAVFSCSLAAVFAGGIALSPGHSAFQMFGTHPDPFDFAHLRSQYGFAIQCAFVAVAIIICAVAGGLKWTERTRILWIYLGACSITMLTAGKAGSNTNHLLEWMAAVCILTALSMQDLYARGNRLLRPFAFGILALMAAWTLESMGRANLRPDQCDCGSAYAYVASFPSAKILSEDTGALVVDGKTVSISNPFVMTQLGNLVRWSRGSLAELAQGEYFDLIILGGRVENYDPGSGRWPADFIHSISEHYVLARQFQCAPYLGAAYVRAQR